MPTWITPRRLRATTVLYAVFVGGWYLGQPLPDVGCHPFEPAIASVGPDTIKEPAAEITATLSRTFTQVVTTEIVSTDGIVECDPYNPHPRLVAWVTGDWR